jgi:hypothetical protein
MKRTVILALAVIMVLATAVGFASAKSNGSAQKKSEYVIQTLIPGESNTVKAGSKFIVALKENATTGIPGHTKSAIKKESRSTVNKCLNRSLLIQILLASGQTRFGNSVR